MSSSVLELGIDELMPDPDQVRTVFEPEALARLAASIQARGILHPLRVIHDEERRAWRIVAGEMRWRAARLAGLAAVPCLPVVGTVTEADILCDQIVENHVRQDLTPMELARALVRLKTLKKATSQAIAAELGLSPASITRGAALLELPIDIQAMVDDGRVPESAAYEISRLKNDERAQFTLAHAVAEGRMTRDAAAEAVRSRIGKRRVAPRASRVACRLDNGLSITMSSGQPLAWKELIESLERLRREAKRLSDGGQDVAALAEVLKDSDRRQRKPPDSPHNGE